MEAKDQELPLTTVMDCLIQAHMGCQHWVPFARWAAEHILALSWQGYKEQLGGGGRRRFYSQWEPSPDLLDAPLSCWFTGSRFAASWQATTANVHPFK